MNKELLVVGLDHTPAGNAALKWAVREAAQRGARLLTVHVANLGLERDPAAERSRAAIRLHEQVVRRLGSEDEAVPVAVSVVAGTLVDRLGKAAEHAALLVIGEPQSPDHVSLPDALALRSTCPVMVVNSLGQASQVSSS